MQMQSRIDRQDLARTAAAVPARALPRNPINVPATTTAVCTGFSKCCFSTTASCTNAAARERCQAFSGVQGGEETQMKEAEWARGVNLRGI